MPSQSRHSGYGMKWTDCDASGTSYTVSWPFIAIYPAQKQSTAG